MYIDTIEVFETTLANTAPIEDTEVLLDLSRAETDELTGVHFDKILNGNQHAIELTIDFGEKFNLPHKMLQSLMNGLATDQHLISVTLCFWGRSSLSAQNIQTLIQTLTSQKFHAILTLQISGVNLREQRLFTTFIDAITSPDCQPWLTVEFLTPEPGAPRITSDEVAYIIEAVKRESQPLGGVVDIGFNGDEAQRHELFKSRERAARFALNYLQANPESHKQLKAKTKAELTQACQANKNWVHHKVETHIHELEGRLLSKARRTEALRRLQQRLSEKNDTEAYQVIQTWETFVLDGDIYTEAQRISSLNERFSSFRSNQKVLTSTEALIAELKSECTTIEPSEGANLAKTLSITTDSTESPHSLRQ